MRSDLAHSRWPNKGRYMPHVVLGAVSEQSAQLDPLNRVLDKYLGVWVLDAADELAPGESYDVTLALVLA